MTPTYEILAGQADVTRAIRGRLLSLTLTDEAGYQSTHWRSAWTTGTGRLRSPGAG